jgi:microcystin-dependent protein
MAEPFIGEVKIASFAFAPRGWALCNGQLLPINQNQALFSILGTTYGGNGTTNFALPNLQGRTPIHLSNSHPQGEMGGEPTHTLTQSEFPTHNHHQATGNQATSTTPAGNILASKPRRGKNVYAEPNSLVVLKSDTAAGGSQPHGNMQPYLGLNFIIALQGIFPSRN